MCVAVTFVEHFFYNKYVYMMLKVNVLIESLVILSIIGSINNYY